MKFKFSTKLLLPALLLIGTFTMVMLDTLPSYTKLALTFLIISTIFFIFRKEEKINEKKYLIVILFSILATIFYDTIAQTTWLWRFPKESVSFWILGIPVEEYIFGFWFPTIVLGIYTSLHKSKRKTKNILNNFPHLKESVLFGIMFSLQIIVWAILFLNPTSYLGWVIFLAFLPSIFYTFRKGEKVDERRLLITIVLMMLMVVIIDLIFIPPQTWYYNEYAILGKIGSIPIDDFLFTIFNTIFVVGFYTSLPDKKILSRPM